MVETSRVPAPPPSRRAVLRTAGAGTLLALAACRSTPPPAAPPPPLVDPDDAVRQRSADAERALLEAYDAALVADPAAAARLAPVRAEHAEHLAALAVPAGLSGPAPSLTTGDLAAAERSAAAVHGRGTRDARQPALAQLLGSLAASEGSHVVVLTAVPA